MGKELAIIRVHKFLIARLAIFQADVVKLIVTINDLVDLFNNSHGWVQVRKCATKPELFCGTLGSIMCSPAAT